MTKLETTIRQVSDLRDFYMKIKKEKSNNLETGTARRCKARKLLALEGNMELAERVDDLIKRRRKDVPGR